jgi:hypothetical protein
MREQDERDLRALLRDEAERHHPDRDAMLERIVRTRSESRSTLRNFLRPLAAAGAVALVAVGIVGVRIAGDQGEPDSTTPAVAPTRSVPSESKSPSPSRTQSARPRIGPRDGFLSSQGQVNANPNPSWRENDLFLTNTRAITELDVTITVDRVDAPVHTGRFTTIPENMLTITVSEERDAIVYRFRLKEGTLAPGRYTFAAQFNHRTGERPSAGDTYEVTARAGSADAEVAGHF